MRKTFARTHKQLLAALFIFTLSCGALATPLPPDKMTAEEVVAKHLASIGTAEDLAAAKSRLVMGKAKAIARTGVTRDLDGPAQLASDGDKVLFAMVFGYTAYPYEKAGYDGQKFTVALWETTGSRSALGDFLLSQDTIFKQGLITGVLSSAWPLYNLSARGAKLSYSGTEKINGRQVHKLKYTPRKGGANLTINLFFDAETFHHVRTEYKYAVSPTMSERPVSSVAAATSPGDMNHYQLVEDFSDFRPEGKLTLPHNYHLRLSIDTQINTQVLEWALDLTQFAFNQPIDAEAFNVGRSK